MLLRKVKPGERRSYGRALGQVALNADVGEVSVLEMTFETEKDQEKLKT